MPFGGVPAAVLTARMTREAVACPVASVWMVDDNVTHPELVNLYRLSQ